MVNVRLASELGLQTEWNEHDETSMAEGRAIKKSFKSVRVGTTRELKAGRGFGSLLGVAPKEKGEAEKSVLDFLREV